MQDAAGAYFTESGGRDGVDDVFVQDSRKLYCYYAPDLTGASDENNDLDFAFLSFEFCSR